MKDINSTAATLSAGNANVINDSFCKGIASTPQNMIHTPIMENFCFDGKRYWQRVNEKWFKSSLHEIQRHLKCDGISSIKSRSANKSELDYALAHIQKVNRVEWAAPFINYPKGVITVDDKRVLNIANLHMVQPLAGMTGEPDKDFPWIWMFLNGLFSHPELLPLDHFLSWLQRSYEAILCHKCHSGQVVFLCGPPNNGKTLLCTRIVRSLLGNHMANPFDFLTGRSVFNDYLFDSALLAINDEDYPFSIGARKRMSAKLADLIANPWQTYRAKFAPAVPVKWMGRILITLCDDPDLVGMMMDASHSIRDMRMCFFTRPYAGPFPQRDELEARIKQELPAFAYWLTHTYQPPAAVVTNDGMGVKSYSDPYFLPLINKDTPLSNTIPPTGTYENN